MPNHGITLIGKLRQAMAWLWQRLSSVPGIIQQGPGTVATTGGRPLAPEVWRSVAI